MDNLDKYAFIDLRDRPGLINLAAAWFHANWGVPEQAYLDCMTSAGICAWMVSRSPEGLGSSKTTSMTAKILHRMSARYTPKKPAGAGELPGVC